MYITRDFFNLASRGRYRDSPNRLSKSVISGLKYTFEFIALIWLFVVSYLFLISLCALNNNCYNHYASGY